MELGVRESLCGLDIRVFEEADYKWLQIIECLKKTGVPLKDIREYIRMSMQGDEPVAERLKLIIRQQVVVRR